MPSTALREVSLLQMLSESIYVVRCLRSLSLLVAAQLCLNEHRDTARLARKF